MQRTARTLQSLEKKLRKNRAGALCISTDSANSPAVDSPQGEVAGPKGTGKANGQDYYGVDVDEGCKPETALACGTIECKA